MTRTSRSSVFAFALVALFPTIAVAQDCLAVMDQLCGEGQSITDCAYDGTIWNYVPDRCIGDFQTALENEAGYYAEQAVQSQQGGVDCFGVMDEICGAGNSVTDCAFDGTMWNYVPDMCVGDFQTAIENEREFYDQQAEQYQAPVAQSGALTGFSYGGNLRTGPGGSYPSIAVLAEGDWLDIVENSGAFLDGYAWFYVRSARGEGYQWGGIICSDASYIEGVYSVC